MNRVEKLQTCKKKIEKYDSAAGCFLAFYNLLKACSSRYISMIIHIPYELLMYDKGYYHLVYLLAYLLISLSDNLYVGPTSWF